MLVEDFWSGVFHVRKIEEAAFWDTRRRGRFELFHKGGWRGTRLQSTESKKDRKQKIKRFYISGHFVSCRSLPYSPLFVSRDAEVLARCHQM